MAVSCWAIGSTVSARLHGVKHFFSIKRNLDKIYEVLAARHLYFFKVLAARKTYLITARARRNKPTARMLASARKDHSIPLICISSRFYCQTIAFAMICVATFRAKMLQHVQVIYFVIRCEAKFSQERLEIFKCTPVKCLLETNLAPSVKPSIVQSLETNFQTKNIVEIHLLKVSWVS